MKNQLYQGAATSLAVFFLSVLPLFSSDMSDAEALRVRCERESRPLEVCVMNFGDAVEKSNFAEAVKRLKQGKLKITQSKFKEAIDIYNGYLGLQKDLYMGLAGKYIERTRKLNDEIAEEMVDSIDKPKVDSYFKLAYRSLENAKAALLNSNPTLSIDSCRRSKQYSIGVYGLVGKPVPERFKTDMADAEGKIAGK